MGIKVDKVMKKRLLYIDVLKVISVFAMMVLHVAGSNFFAVDVTSMQWQIFNFYDSLVRFCVPVFVMCSGVVFLDNTNNITVAKILKKYIPRIIVAFAFWSFAYAFYRLSFDIIFREQINAINLYQYVKLFFTGHYHMWFLFTIVGLYLIVPFLRLITTNKKLTEYFLLLSLIFCFFINFITIIPQIKEIYDVYASKLHLHFFGGFSSYFVLGYYLHKNDLSKKVRVLIYALGVTMLIFTIVGTSIISIIRNKPTTTLYENLLPNTLFTSMAIFVFVKQAVQKRTLSNCFTKTITAISILSFAMYLTHDFFNIILSGFNFSTLNYNAILSVPIQSLIVFILSLITAWILKKIPVLNKWIM